MISIIEHKVTEEFEIGPVHGVTGPYYQLRDSRSGICNILGTRVDEVGKLCYVEGMALELCNGTRIYCLSNEARVLNHHDVQCAVFYACREIHGEIIGADVKRILSHTLTLVHQKVPDFRG